MKQKSPISLLLSFTLVVCGGNTTEQDTQTQPQQTQEDTQTQPQQTQEDTQTQPQQTQGQGPQNNNNPFLDPNYSDCLKDKFGEERYKELQNQQPTPEEEQRIGECMGGQGPQGQGPQGQGPQGQGPQGQGPQGQGPQGQGPQGQGPQGQGPHKDHKDKDHKGRRVS